MLGKLFHLWKSQFLSLKKKFGMIKQISKEHCIFPGGLVVKNPPANPGDASLIPKSGRSSGEGNGNPLQCSCLGNPVGKGAWCSCKVHGVAKSQIQLMTKQKQSEVSR